MRHAPLVLVLSFVLTACASDGSPPPRGGSSGGAPVANGGGPVRGALPRDVFPLAAPAARFVTSQGGSVEVRLEPYEGGTAMWLSGEGLAERRVDWIVEGASIYCSDGPDRRVEFLRVGALPGTAWESSGRTIRFDGWERVETPAGPFDAVRISSRVEVPPYTEVETWWFAPGVGLVRMRVDKADLYALEMKRLR